MRLLLVEDDDALARVLSHAIEDEIPVDTVRYAAAAQHALARHGYAGVVIDERLPDGSGLDLAASVRAADSRLPMLLHTADESPHLARRASALGVLVSLKPSYEPIRQFVRLVIAAWREQADATGVVARLPASSLDESLHAAGVTLTRAELAALELALDGVHGPVAAARLGISVGAYRKRLRRVFVKTGQQNMRAVLAWIASLRSPEPRSSQAG